MISIIFMLNLVKIVNKKVNGVIFSLLSTGVILMMLSVLIVWTDFMLRLVIGVFVLVVSYVFVYGAYKLWVIRKEVEKYFKINIK
jgi:hypothetical protein